VKPRIKDQITQRGKLQILKNAVQVTEESPAILSQLAALLKQV
jgi:hypothetical protein